jgi:TRAP-type C4-dicarboxylate transport system substrate-binding protein
MRRPDMMQAAKKLADLMKERSGGTVDIRSSPAGRWAARRTISRP